MKGLTMAISGTARDCLKRNKLDHTESIRTDYYKAASLNSHKRPVQVIPELRRPDRARPRPKTEPLQDVP